MDIPDAAFSPLDMRQFTTFFLVPYVTHKLIAEDMHCDEAKAYKIMIDSGEVGEGLYPEDDEDPELQAILDSNSEAIINAQQSKEVAMQRTAGAQVRDRLPSSSITAHKGIGKDNHNETTRPLAPPRFAKKIFIVVRCHSSALNR